MATWLLSLATLILSASACSQQTAAANAASCKSGFATTLDSCYTDGFSSTSSTTKPHGPTTAGPCGFGVRKTSQRTSSGKRCTSATCPGDGDPQSELDVTACGPETSRPHFLHRSRAERRNDRRHPRFPRLQFFRRSHERQTVQHRDRIHQRTIFKRRTERDV